jgi:2-phosphosulfolactate phosphatase
MPERDVQVHLVPALVPPGDLAGTVAVVIDVLRATTTMVHALAAGCSAVFPCAEVEEARAAARDRRFGEVLLAGERDGLPLVGFDLGNSPEAFSPEVCRGRALVLTTTNGTRALLRAAGADRVLAAAFVNFSAVCEHLLHEARPLNIICAGNGGAVALEDVLLAGALVVCLSETMELRLNDSGRLARNSFEKNGPRLAETLADSAGGTGLCRLGYAEDVRAAARVDRFAVVPELRREPLRLEAGAAGRVGNHWRF